MVFDINLIEQIKSLNQESLQFKEICKTLAKDINSKTITITQLVQNLESILLDTQPETRVIGICTLSNIFENLDKNIVDLNQLMHILNFYCDKLKDHHLIIPATLQGLLHLINLQQLPEGCASKILRAIFNNVVCQQQQQKDRYNIYQIFDILFRNYRNELVLMGIDLVYGVITAIDSERDPNNLNFVYKWVTNFFKVMDLKHLNEESFEVFACYFPVDFKAPRQDPNVITRENLADSLAYCLTSRPDFAQFCLPLALEKLESSLEIAKLDSLHLLEIGCNNFDAADYVRHFSDIWSKIYQNLIENVPEQVQTTALGTISRVIEKISQESNFRTLLMDILSCVKRNLVAESRFFTITGKLLVHAARASKLSSEIVIDNVLPQLLNTFSLERDVVHKSDILQLLIDLFGSYVLFHDKIEVDDLKMIFVLCASNIEGDDKLRQISYESLALFPQFLNTDVRLQVYKSLRHDIVLEQSEIAKKATDKCLLALSRNFPDEIKDNVLVQVVVNDLKSIEFYLKSIFLLLPQTYFTCYILETFYKFLIMDESSHVAIKCLSNYIVQKEDDSVIQQIIYKNNVILQLLDWVKNSNNLNETTLQHLSLILKVVVGNQNIGEQEKILNTYYKDICDNLQDIKTKISIIDGLVCRLRRELQSDLNLYQFLLDVILVGNDEFVRNISLVLLANLINKCQNEEFLEGFLGEINRKIVGCSKQGETFAWITKALLMRNHKLSDEWIHQMLDLWNRDKSTASHFQIVLNDDNVSLSTKSYCNKWLLYRQKFFVIVTDSLIKNVPLENPNIIGYLLIHAPKAVVSLEFKKIFDLLMQCLIKCDVSDVLLIILDCFQERIIQQESILNENMPNVLSVLMKLSLPDNKMKVRIQALKCLQAYAQFPLHRTIQFQNQVLANLKQCIDDKKRFVRKEATEAILLWTMIDMTT